MIDIHLHLDGSLPPELLIKLAKMEGVKLPAADVEELIPFLTVPENCESLNQFLEKFDLPVSCMQSDETLYESARGLLQELTRQDFLYAEIRFAPQLHRRKGMTQRQVIEAVASGIRDGQRETGIRAGLILCCMRGRDNHEENLETVRLAGEFLNRGVCAIDLAGAEALFPTREFEDLFVLARNLQVPFTIHAGEADGPDSVRDALRFGAKRLGHGIRAAEDPALLDEIRQKGIILEVCVTSNFQTKAVSAGADHPILTFLRQGIKVTANTDDMTVCGTTMAGELAYLRAHGMTKEEEERMLLHAVDGAFLSAEEKKSLEERIRSRMKQGRLPDERLIESRE